MSAERGHVVDPASLPDGTPVEAHSETAGALRPVYKDRDGFVLYADSVGRAVPILWGNNRIVAILHRDGECPAREDDPDEWVDVELTDVPLGAVYRAEYLRGDSARPLRLFVRRRDLPKPDPDAALIEAMARAMYEVQPDTDSPVSWTDVLPDTREAYLADARVALAALREHEAKGGAS